MKYLTRVLSAVLLLALSSSLFAQGSVSDGGWTFEINSFDAAPRGDVSSDLFRPDGTENVFEVGFYYRTDTDTRELGLGVPDSQTYVGNQVVLTYNDVGNLGLFSAEVTITLNAATQLSADLDTSVVMTNLGTVPQTVDFYFYLDADLNGSIGGDSAELLSPTSMRIVDPLAEATYSSPGADAYQVTPFAALLNALNDGDVDDLDNTGLPFGPGDFTGAFQFDDAALGAGASTTFTNSLALSSIFGIEREIQNVPVNAPWAILALLLLTALLARRQLSGRRSV